VAKRKPNGSKNDDQPIRFYQHKASCMLRPSYSSCYCILLLLLLLLLGGVVGDVTVKLFSMQVLLTIPCKTTRSNKKTTTPERVLSIGKTTLVFAYLSQLHNLFDHQKNSGHSFLRRCWCISMSLV